MTDDRRLSGSIIILDFRVFVRPVCLVVKMFVLVLYTEFLYLLNYSVF